MFQLAQKLLYSGKVVVFGQKWLYSGERGCIRAKWLFFEQNCCIRAKCSSGRMAIVLVTFTSSKLARFGQE